MKGRVKQLKPLRNYLAIVFFVCCIVRVTSAKEVLPIPVKVQGVNVEKLLANLGAGSPEQKVEVSRHGVLFSLRDRDGCHAGLFRLGVFGDAETAQKRFEALIDTPVFPVVFPCPFVPGVVASEWRKILEQEEMLGCGDCVAIWNHFGEGRNLTRICFRREDVLVDLWKAPADVLRKRAWQVDALLISGGGGVRKGTRVTVPLWNEEKCLAWLAVGMPNQTEEGYLSLTYAKFPEREVCFAGRDCVLASPLKWNPAWEGIEERRRNAISPEQIEARKARTRSAIAVLENENTSAFERASAVMILGQSCDISTVPWLLRELGHTTELTVKQNAIWALAKLKACRAVPELIGILETPVTGNIKDVGEDEAIIRATAVYALGQIGDRRAMTILTAIVHSAHEYQSVQDAALAALRLIEAK